MDQVQLIELAMQRSNAPSLRALAEKTEIDVGSLSRWHKDERQITIEGVLILAKLANLKPEAIAGQIAKPRTNSKLLRQVLKDWAKIAAALLLAVTASPARSNGIQLYNSTNPGGMYIMSSNRRRKRKLARHLLRRKPRRLHARPAA